MSCTFSDWRIMHVHGVKELKTEQSGTAILDESTATGCAHVHKTLASGQGSSDKGVEPIMILGQCCCSCRWPARFGAKIPRQHPSWSQL